MQMFCLLYLLKILISDCTLRLQQTVSTYYCHGRTFLWLSAHLCSQHVIMTQSVVQFVRETNFHHDLLTRSRYAKIPLCTSIRKRLSVYCWLWNKYERPPNTRTEMYANDVACCANDSRWVGRVPSLEKDGTDGRTDGRTPDRNITLSAGRGQHNKLL